MAATTIRHWGEASPEEIFFFAHPLTLPLTRLFDLLLPFDDAFVVVLVRESFFAGAVTGACFLFLHSLLRKRLRAALVAAAFAFAHSRWRLATLGEEKETMLFFFLLTVIPFAHLRGWVDLPELRRAGRMALAAGVGSALALAFAVHLQNGLLVPFLALCVVVRRGFARTWRTDLPELAVLYGTAGAITLAFFAPVAYFAAGVRDLQGLATWLFEYHLSGEFVSLGYTVPGRTLEAYGAFREYVAGTLLGAPSALECAFAIGASALVVRRALAEHREVASAALLFLGLMALHFFNYRQEPEAWSGSAVPGLLLLALATARLDFAGDAAWAVVALALLSLDAGSFATRARGVRPQVAASTLEAGWLERRTQQLLPEAQAALAVDRSLPRGDGAILVEHRHLANAFLVYTARRPVVAPYLGRDPAWFGPDGAALTVLSRHWYLPPPGLEGRLRAGPGFAVFLLLRDEGRVPIPPRFLPGGKWRRAVGFDLDGFVLYKWAPGPESPKEVPG